MAEAKFMPAEPFDLRCIRCGYILGGIPHDQPCPECGLAINRSLVLGKALRESRPRWIATLAVASLVMVLAQLVLALLPLMLAVGDLRFLVIRRDWAIAVVLLAAAWINWVGACLLTRKEDPFARSRPDPWLVLAIRSCSGSAWLAMIILLALYWRWGFAIYDYSFVPVYLLIPCPFLVFTLLRRLAHRVLNQRLMEYSAIVGLGYPLAIFLVLWVPPFLERKLNNPVFFAMDLIVIVLPPLFWLWSMAALGYFAIAFARAAREARQAWRRADAAAQPPMMPPAATEAAG